MKSFTDLFIRRPVLAIVINLVIIIAGLQAYRSLNVRQYPRSENASVTVTTAYVGASAELVRGFITTPLERAIAECDGIDYVQSNSAQSVSTITARLKLNYDANKALSEISTKVNKVRGDLPPEAHEMVELPRARAGAGEHRLHHVQPEQDDAGVRAEVVRAAHEVPQRKHGLDVPGARPGVRRRRRVDRHHRDAGEHLEGDENQHRVAEHPAPTRASGHCDVREVRELEREAGALVDPGFQVFEHDQPTSSMRAAVPMR